jgi:hypothetical protein
MKSLVRCVVALHLLASGAFVSACGSRSIPLQINVPSGVSAQASAMEVYVVATCPSDTTRPPAVSRAMSSWRRGEASQPLAGTLPERFGVLVMARDAMCGVVASRCVDATRNDERVLVDLIASTGPACATSTCVSGLCVSGDAPMSVPLDAPTMDAPSADAGTDAFIPESACDCIDDDMDTRFDEGCGLTGGGDVIWQTPFDGPGDQGFRSLVVGGDGRLYSNGWMTTGSAMLCGRMLTSPSGISRSWTFSFNAATGVCETALERDTPNEAPFASVWRGAEGVWMYVPGALVEMVNGVEVDRIALTPGADFNAGHVRVLPSAPTRLLASYRATQGPFMAGAISGTNDRGNIIAYIDSAAAAAVAVAASDVVTPGVAAWVDASTFVTIGPNTMSAPGCTMPSGASRIEIRDIAAPNTCVRTFGTDFRLYEPGDMRNFFAEQQTIVTGRTLWVIARAATTTSGNGPISVRAFNLDDGTSHAFPLPSAPDDLSPSVMLAPAADGTLFIGTTSNGTPSIPGLDARAGGYVIHLANDASAIRLLGSRRMPGAVAGLDVGPDGTVFVLSGTSAMATLCQRDGTHPIFTPSGNGYVLTAIDFTP